MLIVPDGALNLVPLAALPVGSSAYLIERGPVIHYLSAERDVVVEDGAARRTGVGLLSLGGPDFNDARALLRPSGATTSSRAARSPWSGVVELVAQRNRRVDASRRGVDLRQHPATPIRGAAPPRGAKPPSSRSCGATSPASNHDIAPRLLAGADGDRTALKASAPGHRVLHLATHGFFLGGDASRRRQSRHAWRRRPRRRRRAASSPDTGQSAAALGPRARRRQPPRRGARRAKTTASSPPRRSRRSTWAASNGRCSPPATPALGEVRPVKASSGCAAPFRSPARARDHEPLVGRGSRRAARGCARSTKAGFGNSLDTADAVRERQPHRAAPRGAPRGQSTHPFFWAGFVAAGDWR